MRDIKRYKNYLIFARGAEWFVEEDFGKYRCYGPYKSEKIAELMVDAFNQQTERCTWPKKS